MQYCPIKLSDSSINNISGSSINFLQRDSREGMKPPKPLFLVGCVKT